MSWGGHYQTGSTRLAYHESLDRNLSKVGQDEEFGSLGPLIAGQADEIRGRWVVMLIQYVESTDSQVSLVIESY